MSPKTGAFIFTFMAMFFFFLQEAKSLALLPSLSSRWSWLQKINQWLASRFHTSTQVVLRVEIGALLAFGFTLMQVGEWAAALVCWVLFGFILFAKALTWDGIPGHKQFTPFLRLVYAAGALTLCVLLITITDLRKPEDEPWSNLQKLWEHTSPFSMRITAAAINFPTWVLKETRAHPNVRFCVAPIIAETFLTNETNSWSMISDFHVEAMDAQGTWQMLRVIDTSAPVYAGPNLHHAFPIDGRYFDQQIWDKNLGPHETANGLLLLYSSPGKDIRGPFRFFVSAINGKRYSIGPIEVESSTLPPINFKIAGESIDLGGTPPEECTFRW